MVTDFQDNEHQRHKFLLGPGACPTGNVLEFNPLLFPFLGFQVTLKNLTDYCRAVTVEISMDRHLVLYQHQKVFCCQQLL